ncbi:MAG: CRTAC1 family protein [Nannocystaceae bacterium]|nr:CRTAC1 family protein [Nannocystaceae bacterium]
MSRACIALILASVGCGGDDAPSEVDGTQSTGPVSSSTIGLSDDASSGGSATTAVGTSGGAAECEPRAPVTPTTGFFTDVSESSGIQVGNYVVDPPRGTAINDHSRLAFADIDGDGFDDVVMHSLFPNAQNGVPFEHLVFRNKGDGTFEDVSDVSGLRGVQAAFFAFADVDNDGDQDLFAGLDLPTHSPYGSAIYLNDGAGVFSEVLDAGVATGSESAANASFGDFNGDAIVDLFVGFGGTSFAAPDRLYAGNGDGTFTEMTSALQRPPAGQPSNGSVACDFDDDLDLDLFVSTYSVSTSLGHNRLWQGDGTGLFTEVGVERGFAAEMTGNYWLSATDYGLADEPGATPTTAVGSNGFGIDCGDVDNDGDLDVLATAISHATAGDYGRTWSDPSRLLLNGGAEGGFEFTNNWLQAGLPYNEGDVDGAFVDFDNDGRLDISLSREDKYEEGYSELEQKGWFGLAWQQPDGMFRSVGLGSGINDETADFARVKRAQNHAWSDIDHDGDLDLLVGGRDRGGGRPNFLLRNELGHQNRWLAVRVVGDGSAVSRDAFGTRVSLVAGDGALRMREKKSSRGMYNSEDTRTLHFGLGDLPCDYELIVRWPDGTEASFSGADVGEDRFVEIRYPDGIDG